MGRSAGWIVLLASCGRLGFDDRGAGVDAVRSDATSDDGAAPDAGSGCPYDLCDDFEGAALSPVWSTTGSGVSLDDAIAYHGSQSLHVHTGAFAANTSISSYIAETTTLPIEPSVFYARVFVRFSALPANNLGIVVAEQSDGDPECDGVFVTPDNGLSLYSQFSETTVGSNFFPAPDTWTCVDLTVLRATSATGTLELSGSATLDEPNVITDAAPPIRSFELGIEFADGTDLTAEPALDLWFDDLIVSATPITCAD